MAQVDFYVTEAAEGDARLYLACKVTEKAYLAGSRVLVWCRSQADLARGRAQPPLDNLVRNQNLCDHVAAAAENAVDRGRLLV